MSMTWPGVQDLQELLYLVAARHAAPLTHAASLLQSALANALIVSTGCSTYCVGL